MIQRGYAVQTCRQAMNERGERPEEDGTRLELGTGQEQPAVMIAPLDKPMAVDALVKRRRARMV
jgi:hypothetical protein